MHRWLAFLLFSVTSFGIPTVNSAKAAEPYRLDLTVDGNTVTRTYTSIRDATAVLNTAGVRGLQPGYNYDSALNGTLYLRGVTATVVMQQASPAVRLIIPVASIDRTFTGATREESQRQLRAFLRGSAENVEDLERLTEAFVATTTNDPVAGSPASLLGQSAMADYWAGTQPPGDLGDMTPRAAGWHFGGGFDFQSIRSGDSRAESYSLPLAASYTFGTDGIEVFASVPLMLSDFGGSRAYMGSGGLGVRVPVLRGEQLRWSLSPAFRYGLAGSNDSGAVGASYGPSLTSDLRIALPLGVTLGFGNSVSYYWTKPVELDDAVLKYDLGNTFYRNGVSLAVPSGSLGGREVLLGVSATDTRVTGSRFAVQSWQEYRASVTLGRQAPVRASITFLDGADGYRAWQAGISFAF